MKKRIKALVMGVTLIITLLVGSVGFTANDITVKLNGHTLNFDVPPQVINGRTMVPIRFVAENLNAEVSWDDKDRCITIKY